MSKTSRRFQNTGRESWTRWDGDIDEDERLEEVNYELIQIAKRWTFWTWELTRFTVLNQDQENGEEFCKSIVEIAWSSRSSYTGHMTSANLDKMVKPEWLWREIILTLHVWTQDLVYREGSRHRTWCHPLQPSQGNGSDDTRHSWRERDCQIEGAREH